jgi:hypothetical protein
LQRFRDASRLEDHTLTNFDGSGAVVDADDDERHPGPGLERREILGERTPQHKLW